MDQFEREGWRDVTDTAVDEFDVRLGRRLRLRRRRLGLTQMQLAKAIGVRFQQIHRWEVGATKISAARLWTLAAALQVEISFFFEGLDDEIARAAA
jgi:transcriptional regulator with XRE-family HTH domain